MNKYDWSAVPKEVKWIAMDDDGETWGYSCEPRLGMFSYYTDTCYINFIGYGVFKGNWQDSLEERPNDTKTD